MPVLEQNINALWVAKQSAKGSPVAGTSATKRMVQVGGSSPAIARTDGNEPFSDLDRFGNATDYVDTILGSGEPDIQGHPAQLAYLFWLFCGQETVTGAADPWTHVAQPGTVGPFYSTWWKRVGASVGPVRDKFNDALITQLKISGSQGQKVLHVTPTLQVVDPGEVMTADPTPAMPTTDPLLFTEAEGTFTIDGTVYKVSSFELVANEDRSPYYGDGVIPVDFPTGNPTSTLAVTLLMDSAGIAEYYKRYYGTATPSVNAKPIRVPDALGVFTCKFTKKDAAGPVAPERSAQIDVAGVRWTPDVAVGANQSGGATEVTLAGGCRKVAGQPLWKVTTKVGEAAFTA